MMNSRSTRRVATVCGAFLLVLSACGGSEAPEATADAAAGGSVGAAGGAGTAGAGAATGKAGAGGGTGLACAPGVQGDAACKNQLPPTTPPDCATPACDVATRQCKWVAKDADGDGYSRECASSTPEVKVEHTGSQRDCVDGNKDIHPGAWDGPKDATHPGACNMVDDDCNLSVDDGKLPDGSSCTCKIGDSVPCAENDAGATVTFPGGVPKGLCKLGKRTCELVGGKAQYGTCKGTVGPSLRACASKDDNDCDGVPDNTKDAVCECQPTDDPACKPAQCPGTRLCQFSGTSSKWGPCNAPADCSCTAAVACSMGNSTPACTGFQQCITGKLDVCKGAKGDALKADCQCDPGGPSKSCAAIAGNTKTCGTATCGADQKWAIDAPSGCTAPIGCWKDADGDGFGAGMSSQQCGCAPGYVANNGDCNDADPKVHGEGDVCTTTGSACPGKWSCSANKCIEIGCTGPIPCTVCGGAEAGTRACNSGCVPAANCVPNAKLDRSWPGAFAAPVGGAGGCGGVKSGPAGWIAVSSASANCFVADGLFTDLPVGLYTVSVNLNPGGGTTDIEAGLRSSNGTVVCGAAKLSFSAQGQKTFPCNVATDCQHLEFYVRYKGGDNSFALDGFGIKGN